MIDHDELTPVAVPAEGENKLLLAIKRSADQEIRAEWSWYEGHAFNSVRVWNRDRHGKWWPDSKRGVSIRIGELQEFALAFDMAEAYRQDHRRQYQAWGGHGRPRRDLPQKVRSAHSRPAPVTRDLINTWFSADLPPAEPTGSVEPFNEFE
jgi:hypothetical protein